MKHIFLVLSAVLLTTSCAVSERSNIKASETLVIEMKQPASRGGLVETALEGLFYGASFLAEKSSKALHSDYTQSLSIPDYYNTDLGMVQKTYSEIHLKKFSQPMAGETRNRLEQTIRSDIDNLPKTRGGTAAVAFGDFTRLPENDLMNFHAVIEILSDPENPGISRLSFKELSILFSKTKVYSDLDLNARISLSLVGHWRDRDGTPVTQTLMEQEYTFTNLNYGLENQIEQPILSPWYYDIPPIAEEGQTRFGLLQVHVQLQEYEGSKSRYIDKLPGILSDNKDAIISNGTSVIENLTKQ